MPRLAAARRAEPATARRPRWLRGAVATLVGAGLLGLLLHHAGLEPIALRMSALGWSAPLVLLPYAIIAAMDTLGWHAALPRADAGQVHFRSLYLVRMGGESINSVLPAATVGGEGVKVYLLRSFGVSGSGAVASLVITKAALTVTQSLFVVLGVGALFLYLGRPAAGAAWFAVLLLAFAAFTLGLIHLQRRGPTQAVWRVLRRVAPRARLVERLHGRVAAVDEHLQRFYAADRRFWGVAAWHLLGWLFGVVEVSLIMRLIEAPVSFAQAFIIESLAQVVRATALVIPGGLGSQEVGGVAICRFLGVAEPAAVTLWLLKRARELVFDAIGAIYVVRYGSRVRSAA